LSKNSKSKLDQTEKLFIDITGKTLQEKYYNSADMEIFKRLLLESNNEVVRNLLKSLPDNNPVSDNMENYIRYSWYDTLYFNNKDNTGIDKELIGDFITENRKVYLQTIFYYEKD
jgi:hypothetical protein